MYYDLSKKDKKIARLLIDKALDAQYKAALEEAQELISSWRKEELNNRDAYLRLYKILDRHDNSIARRYNGLGGSRYLMTVASVLYDGFITNDDLKDFSDEPKEIINRWIGLQNRE